MQTGVEIWNTLHDGTIVAISGKLPGDVLLKIEIQYLCDTLCPGSSFIWIYLHDCQKLEYLEFEGTQVIKDFELLNKMELEILSATQENDIQVCCVSGILKLQYASASCKLDNGTQLSFKAIAEAANKYWSDWTDGHLS